MAHRLTWAIGDGVMRAIGWLLVLVGIGWCLFHLVVAVSVLLVYRIGDEPGHPFTYGRALFVAARWAVLGAVGVPAACNRGVAVGQVHAEKEHGDGSGGWEILRDQTPIPPLTLHFFYFPLPFPLLEC